MPFFVLFFSVLSIWPWCLRQITEYHSARCDMIFIYYIPRQNLHKSSFWWSALWGWIKKPQGFCWCFYILILIYILWRCAGTVLGTWWCFFTYLSVIVYISFTFILLLHYCRHFCYQFYVLMKFLCQQVYLYVSYGRDAHLEWSQLNAICFLSSSENKGTRCINVLGGGGGCIIMCESLYIWVSMPFSTFLAPILR